MLRLFAFGSIAISSLFSSIAAAAPTPPAAGTLDADLATIRENKKWFFRESLVGWTADHRVVFRTAVCDEDSGGGRGSYCDIYVCVAKAEDAADRDRALSGECTDLVTFEIDETGPKGNRTTVDAAAAHKAETALLGKLGTLSAGTALPAASFKPSTAKKKLALVRGGKAGKGKIGRASCRERVYVLV